MKSPFTLPIDPFKLFIIIFFLLTVVRYLNIIEIVYKFKYQVSTLLLVKCSLMHWLAVECQSRRFVSHISRSLVTTCSSVLSCCQDRRTGETKPINHLMQKVKNQMILYLRPFVQLIEPEFTRFTDSLSVTSCYHNILFMWLFGVNCNPNYDPIVNKLIRRRPTLINY